MRQLSQMLSLFLVLALCLALVPTSLVYAEETATADTPVPNIAELQEQVDAAATVYDEANQHIATLEKEISATNSSILEIQSELPEARKVSNKAAREYYVMLSGNNQFLEIMLGAETMEDFFAKLEYIARMNQSFLENISKLSTLQTELEAQRTALEEKKAEIEAEELRAEEALIEAQNARDVAEETARQIAEATAKATAEAAAKAEAEQHTPEEPITPDPEPSPSPNPSPDPGGSDPGQPEAPSEKQAYINVWAPRIDAYLAGSPMAGYGYAFANAAYDYNVDPRWSPAIACLESSKGRYCFLPYNAWGWGSISWTDWETAIYSHVRGLSIGYGYTISEAAAQKYCPPNWEHWYSFISSQMASI